MFCPRIFKNGCCFANSFSDKIVGNLKQFPIYFNQMICKTLHISNSFNHNQIHVRVSIGMVYLWKQIKCKVKPARKLPQRLFIETHTKLVVILIVSTPFSRFRHFLSRSFTVLPFFMCRQFWTFQIQKTIPKTVWI